MLEMLKGVPGISTFLYKAVIYPHNRRVMQGTRDGSAK
jgi:hypothetical protein